MDHARVDSNSTLHARRKLALDMIERDAPLHDTLAMLCHIVEAEAPTLVRADILLVDEDGKHLRTGAAPGLPDRYNEAIDGIAISASVGTCTAAAALRRPMVCTDIAHDPAWNGLSHLPLGLGLVAVWSMPIIDEAGEVLGTIGTYFTDTRAPTDHERWLVAELVPTAALAITRARLHASHVAEQAA